MYAEEIPPVIIETLSFIEAIACCANGIGRFTLGNEKMKLVLKSRA